MRGILGAFLVTILMWVFGDGAATTTAVVRGKPQQLRLYGDREGEPVIVASGDGGWLHLAPHVAEVLAARGFYVVGFDAKAYLRSFTENGKTLSVDDAPASTDRPAPSDTPIRIGLLRLI